MKHFGNVDEFEAAKQKEDDSKAADHQKAADLEGAVNPTHYKGHPSGIEPIQITAYETFLRGNILKYVLRAPYKGREMEDLLKAAQYLRWEIQRVREEQEDDGDDSDDSTKGGVRSEDNS